MNKQELTDMIAHDTKMTHRAQLRPSTYIRLQIEHNQRMWQGVGFAKVCRPDKWDSARGYELARQKAIAHIVRQILGKCERY